MARRSSARCLLRGPIAARASLRARNRADAVRLRETLSGYGVSILSAADGYVDPEPEAGLFLTGIREIKAEADSRETGRRVRRGVGARTRQGWVSGRKTPFGYARKAVFSETETDRDGRPLRLGVKLEPDPLRGPIVTHIFRRHAQGMGLRRIAHELNAPDGPYRAAKPKGYAATFLRSLLLNLVYRGHVVYGRTRERKVRVGDDFKRRKVAVPPEEWVVTEGAHMPLVDEETWSAVQARFEKNKGKAFGREGAHIRGGRSPASVLSGVVRCRSCGANYVIWTSSRNAKQRRRGTGRDQRRFACNRARSSAGDLCSNRTTVEAPVLERATFDALEEHVLTAEGLAYLDARRRAFLEEHFRQANGQGSALQAERTKIEKEEEQILSAIKAGLPLAALREEAEGLAERRLKIHDEIERLSVLESAREVRLDDHRRTTRLSNLREALEAPDLQEVRAALRDLIVGIEAREDGSFWLLVGEGPLGSDDLVLLPPTDKEPGGAAVQSSPEGNARESRVKPQGRRRTPPGRATGTSRGSRICMVGATGLEPATS